MFLADGLLAFGVTTRGAWQTSVRLCLSRQSADAYGKPPMAGAHVSVCVCVCARVEVCAWIRVYVCAWGHVPVWVPAYVSVWILGGH